MSDIFPLMIDRAVNIVIKRAGSDQISLLMLQFHRSLFPNEIKGGTTCRFSESLYCLTLIKTLVLSESFLIKFFLPQFVRKYLGPYFFVSFTDHIWLTHHSASGWKSNSSVAGWTNWERSSFSSSLLLSSYSSTSLWEQTRRTGPYQSLKGLRAHAPWGSLRRASLPSMTPSTCWCRPTWTRELKALTYASLACLRETPSSLFTVSSAVQACYQPQLQLQFQNTQTTLAFPSSLRTSCVRFLKTATPHTSVFWLNQTRWGYLTNRGFR